MGCGHPDKVADAISDAILDACLAQDPESRVGCETLVKGNQVILAGEITTKAKLDYEQIVRDTVHRIGYRTAQDDPVFNSESLNVTNLALKRNLSELSLKRGMVRNKILRFVELALSLYVFPVDNGLPLWLAYDRLSSARLPQSRSRRICFVRSQRRGSMLSFFTRLC